ncbi:hypothetical protein BofuT4_uP123450.1 [Botrytis cinerea T4]|uniref:Uncharacterized protein n=1 Tax=Botryotinia fuckeliana (strain T4) TaxID=999810 RepID=G2YNX8_BOTF4|nr:hypothetical protein BofuT4_uP123450.1 [Botrytis cinerea T4]
MDPALNSDIIERVPGLFDSPIVNGAKNLQSQTSTCYTMAKSEATKLLLRFARGCQPNNPH